MPDGPWWQQIGIHCSETRWGMGASDAACTSCLCLWTSLRFGFIRWYSLNQSWTFCIFTSLQSTLKSTPLSRRITVAKTSRSKNWKLSHRGKNFYCRELVLFWTLHSVQHTHTHTQPSLWACWAQGLSTSLPQQSSEGAILARTENLADQLVGTC